MKKSVYVYSTSRSKCVYGLTYNKDGSNLPVLKPYGKWEFSQKLDIDENDPPFTFGITPKQIIEEIEKSGYFTVKVKVKIRESILKR